MAATHGRNAKASGRTKVGMTDNEQGFLLYGYLKNRTLSSEPEAHIAENPLLSVRHGWFEVLTFKIIICRGK
jgi:hypothetical protein